ncbi:MAG: LysE family transporter [Sedimentisphaerales bacterium]|nr:LysE family transporter [Sedimentisphaerales bacterium]
MVEIIVFLGTVLIISCSGAMAPGPVTAAAITLGARNKYAGVFFALGHALIEVPLILIIVFGFEKIIGSEKVLDIIGFVGGLFLLWMAFGLYRDIKSPVNANNKLCSSNPTFAGVILSATNPYFLLWWLTIGIKLASSARELGVIAFILFILVHWLCDLVWLGLLSFASFKGAKVMGDSTFKIILGICAIALAGFGGYFIYDSIVK